MSTLYPKMNLSPEATPWGRSVQQKLDELELAAERRAQGELNANKAQNGTLGVLGRNIVNLDAKVQTVFDNLTVDMGQVVSGDLDQSRVTGTWTKAVNAVGNVTASGDMSAANVTGGNVFAQSVATNITATRVSVWARTSDGFLGTASSSRRFKTNIRASSIDPAVVLQIEDVLYQYIDEVRKRDDPTSEQYVGPEYHVATEIGAIAEQLHKLGLWQFVIYEREPNGALILDSEGEPIPDGIHYQMLVMSIFPVLRMQQARLEDIEARLSAAGL